MRRSILFLFFLVAVGYKCCIVLFFFIAFFSIILIFSPKLSIHRMMYDCDKCTEREKELGAEWDTRRGKSKQFKFTAKLNKTENCVYTYINIKMLYNVVRLLVGLKQYRSIHEISSILLNKLCRYCCWWYCLATYSIRNNRN